MVVDYGEVECNMAQLFHRACRWGDATLHVCLAHDRNCTVVDLQGYSHLLQKLSRCGSTAVRFANAMKVVGAQVRFY